MPTRRKQIKTNLKADAAKPAANAKLSPAERRRRKIEANRRYNERSRAGCGVSAYLDSPEEKKAVIEKLRPMGMTVSGAIKTLLWDIVAGRIVFKRPAPRD
ncbi:MAG TPA: hypothetical protein VEX60_10140 [Pyrinomonadaceae bacterium]|nr:hypothetical protein [Pyrinomonadaceae bacterium]